MTFDKDATCEQRHAALEQLLADLNADTRPILLGPWRSEVGFECLYWLPFLRMLAGKVKDFKARAVTVTRGGMGGLYPDIAERAVELFAIRSVKDVRREALYDRMVRQKGKTQKQLLETPWDTEVIAQAASLSGHGLSYHTIHPAWLYWLGAPFWEESAGLAYLAPMMDFQPITAPPLPESCPVKPKSYIAMKWYSRATFPYPHPDLEAFIKDMVGTIARQTPVVLLAGGSEYDDHMDIPIQGNNILKMQTDSPADNLLAQASVIAHASAFVGTYGGMSQLALRMGVPAAAFYAHWGGTALAHLTLSNWISKMTGCPFVTGDLKDVGVWRSVTSAPKELVTA